jgi:hypothetical protein
VTGGYALRRLVEACRELREKHADGGWDPSEQDAFFAREAAVEAVIDAFAAYEDDDPGRLVKKRRRHFDSERLE